MSRVRFNYILLLKNKKETLITPLYTLFSLISLERYYW